MSNKPNLSSRKSLLENKFSPKADPKDFWIKTYKSYKSSVWLDFRNRNLKKGMIFQDDTAETRTIYQIEAKFVQDNPELLTFMKDLKEEAFTQLTDILSELNETDRIQAFAETFNPNSVKEQKAIEAEVSWTENEALDLYMQTFLNIDPTDMTQEI